MTKMISILFLLFMPLFGLAQIPLLDITLVPKVDSVTGIATVLEVKVRPDTTFDGLVSNLQFTIKWKEKDSIQLDMPTFLNPTNILIFPQKAGAQETDSGYVYQKFGGIGLNSLKLFNMSWSTDEEIVILEIPVLNVDSIQLGDFVISEDTKTIDPNFNGIFYAELDAQDRTGIIYGKAPPPPPPTAVDPLLSSSHSFHGVFPNPATEKITLDFSMKTPGEVFAVLYNELGQLVSEKKFNGRVGENQLDWDVSQLATGMYQIGLRYKGVTLNKKVVVMH